MIDNPNNRASSRRKYQRYLAKEGTYVRFSKPDRLDFEIVGLLTSDYILNE